MKRSHLVGIYGSGKPGPDFTLNSTIQNLKDTVQHGEEKKDLDDLRQLIIKIPSFPAIVQHGGSKQVLVDPTNFVFYCHIEELCLPYCQWVLSFCCHGNKYKEGFTCMDQFTRTKYFTKTQYFYPFDLSKFVATRPTTTSFALTNKNVPLNVTQTLCGFLFLCQGRILFHLMPQIVENHCYWFHNNNNHGKDIYKEVLTCADDFTMTGFTFLHQGYILFHVMQRLVANHCYQFNNKHSEDYQQIVNHRRLLPLDSVKLNYSAKFFIQTVGDIVQNLHPIETDFNNNSSITSGTS